MKYVLVTFFDKDLNSFLNIQVSNATEAEAVAGDLTKGLLKAMPKEKAVTFAHRKLYKLGFYDDETGLITEAVPVELLDCDLVLAERIKVDKSLKEVKEYGASE